MSTPAEDDGAFVHLTFEEVVELHDKTITKHGGEPGILSQSPIHAALARCRWGPFVHGDLAERAAMLMRGIAQDHPFVDGNKRTAWIAVRAFLERNGVELRAREWEAVGFTIRLARARLDLDGAARWIRSRVRSL